MFVILLLLCLSQWFSTCLIVTGHWYNQYNHIKYGKITLTGTTGTTRQKKVQPSCLEHATHFKCDKQLKHDKRNNIQLYEYSSSTILYIVVPVFELYKFVHSCILVENLKILAVPHTKYVYLSCTTLIYLDTYAHMQQNH